MNTVGTPSSQLNRPAFFPVEWPLTQNNAGNKQPTARKEGTPKPKRRKIEDTNARCQQWSQTSKITAEHHTLTDKPTVKLVTSVQYQHRGTSISDGKYEPPISVATPNIFKSLDHDEASWLVEEVNEANKCIFGAEKTAEKFKADDEELERKKTSLNALK